MGYLCCSDCTRGASPPSRALQIFESPPSGTENPFSSNPVSGRDHSRSWSRMPTSENAPCKSDPISLDTWGAKMRASKEVQDESRGGEAQSPRGISSEPARAGRPAGAVECPAQDGAGAATPSWGVPRCGIPREPGAGPRGGELASGLSGARETRAPHEG